MFKKKSPLGGNALGLIQLPCSAIGSKLFGKSGNIPGDPKGTPCNWCKFFVGGKLEWTSTLPYGLMYQTVSNPSEIMLPEETEDNLSVIIFSPEKF